MEVLTYINCMDTAYVRSPKNRRTQGDLEMVDTSVDSHTSSPKYSMGLTLFTYTTSIDLGNTIIL